MDSGHRGRRGFFPSCRRPLHGTSLPRNATCSFEMDTVEKGEAAKVTSPSQGVLLAQTGAVAVSLPSEAAMSSRSLMSMLAAVAF